jgi:predicted TIM-barrel fold metal-dependent hydrolase
MGMPANIGVIDLMIGFPTGFDHYDSLRRAAKDKESKEGMDFPVEYMFKGVPKELYGSADPIGVTVAEMDKYGIAMGLIGGDGELAASALARHPDRFFPYVSVDPNEGMDALRKIVRRREEIGVKAVLVFPAGLFPQVAIDDKKMYPIYAKCCELDLPIIVNAGVPGPRVKMMCQHVELIDEVMYDFPELTYVMCHGAEPWTDLAVKLMVKWPGLHYMTSAFAPKHYPKDIIAYANTRGADKILYAGYFPMGLSLERIFTELPNVPFRDHVWPKFLRENAIRVFKLDQVTL